MEIVDTWGLEDFLKATGVGMFQRKIALAARWPDWDFVDQGDKVLFINHSQLGDIREEICFDQDYVWKDGHGNLLTSTAEFTSSPEGGTLLISRSAPPPMGAYTEERHICKNELQFTLTHASGAKWGRTFERV